MFIVGYILLILNLNFVATMILFNLINLIPDVRHFLIGEFNVNLVTWEMFWVLMIIILILVIDRKIRKIFRIPFYPLLMPLYGGVLLFIIKIINPTLSPLEIMSARLLFWGLYFVLLSGYPSVETYLRHKKK